MKIISGLSRWLVSILLIFTMPVLAVQYGPSIDGCSVVNTGPNQWRATFTYKIDVCSGCALATTKNTFSVMVPLLDANGKPRAATQAAANFSNLTTSNPSAIAVYNYTTTVGGYGSVSPIDIIKGTSTIGMNFSTAGNNAYPALYIIYQNQPASGKDYRLWVFSNSCSLGDTLPPDLPPIDEINPPEPSFTLKSAIWDLGTVDVASVPDVAVAGSGYAASINNISNNNLCVSYTTAGVKNNTYALGVTNSASTQGGRNLFTMQGANNSSLFYNLQLVSNDGVTGNNFDFPAGTTKYIGLSQAASGVDKRSEMCWTPKINLFKNASTSAGVHSDTVNFIITPKT